MSPFDERLYPTLELRAAELRQFCGTAQSRVTIELLDTLVSSYLLDLVHGKPEEATATQARILQCRAIASVLRGENTNARS